MNEEVKQIWTTALRSGDFKQGKKRLTTVSANGQQFHCCLGVLCQLYMLDHNMSTSIAGISLVYKTELDDQVTYLPEEVANWADIDFQNQGHLSDRNDGDGCKAHSFEEIADWIDENL